MQLSITTPRPLLARLLCLVRLVSLPLLAAACSSPPPAPQLPPLTYNALPPIRLDVAQVQIDQSYQAPGTAPHIDHLFPQIPAQVAAQWARDRLQAAGQSGQAVYTVTDASATDTVLPRPQSFSAMLTDEQSNRYDLNIAVRLQVTSGDGTRHGAVQVSANRSQTVSEKTTPEQREVVWYQLTQQTMNDLNVKLERDIGAHLAGFLQ
ncbi:hypothetical protein ACFPL7_21795 [Dongia soli]|uniref:Lipoprotein n=1 Tax=Dongia soli TaxID=600628 RepID=A0ABU5E7G1_9PROT|nr:hypothetical protein [Dongia soli]MDY0882225.1 hypothetical protein [Dongia soli]